MTVLLERKISAVLLLLLFLCVSFSSMKNIVLCLEGDGQATVEKRHLDGFTPAIHPTNPNSLQVLLSNFQTGCQSILHLSLVDLFMEDDLDGFYVFFDFPNKDLLSPFGRSSFANYFAGFQKLHFFADTTQNQTLRMLASVILLR